MNATLASEPAWSGDGNEDKVVNLEMWRTGSTSARTGCRSRAAAEYFELVRLQLQREHGYADLQTIIENFGRHSLRKLSRGVS